MKITKSIVSFEYFGCVTLKPLKVGFRGRKSKNFTSETPLKIEFSMGFDLYLNFFFQNFTKSAYSKTRQISKLNISRIENIRIEIFFFNESSTHILSIWVLKLFDFHITRRFFCIQRWVVFRTFSIKSRKFSKFFRNFFRNFETPLGVYKMPYWVGS